MVLKIVAVRIFLHPLEMSKMAHHKIRWLSSKLEILLD